MEATVAVPVALIRELSEEWEIDPIGEEFIDALLELEELAPEENECE